ncbi:MAG: hypothetical protein AB7L13_16310 [Acidimicrobiia bacterium]
MRKLLAIAAIATTSLVGTAGIAAALDTGTGTGPRAKVDCAKATARVATAEQRVTTAKTKLAEVQTKVDALRAAGRSKAADKLAGRVAKASTKVADIEAKLTTATTKLATVCPAGS